MSIEKTEAVVLRAINYRDTSKIVTFYTKRYGKMSAIAKGARNPKSKFGSLFQPLNYLQIVFYRRENRELQYVSSSDFVKYFKSLTSNMDKFAIAMSLIEIVNRVMHDEEENERVFGLLVDSLSVLDKVDVLPQNVFVHFGLHLAIDLGFTPNFKDCLICRKLIDLEKERKVCYVIEKGGPLCEKCSANVNESFLFSNSALLVLQSFVRLSSEAAAKAKMEPALQNELSNFVFVYLKKHSDTLKEIRSLKFLAASK
ncbi:MAG: DNA repair protein RecO [Bacteroidetes bacterium]|nr:DNA repair protein RecO [Bacteroidota bacterium]